MVIDMAAARSVAKTAAAPVIAAGTVLVVLAVWVLLGGFGSVARERIDVLDARMPLPSTPGLTAVYLTIQDSGAQGDELTAASAPGVHETMLMGDVKLAGAGEMKRIDAISIPANGSVSLGPYTADIALEGVGGSLRVGQTVELTLTFRTLGTVTVPVRVAPSGTA
jgi:copper(I)-binding protein